MLICFAGHVDHGKTALIKALTGIDADRLPEEKRRGMTIDLGFAWTDFEGIGPVSIVDVPGHERFLTNMLVGALGAQVAVLCVAADESVMPQTREHVAILRLLPVERLVVAITRADLAGPESRASARQEVDSLLERTRFSGSDMVEVSSRTGEGLDELRSALKRAIGVLDTAPEELRGWYLPIDRVFAVRGRGTVVTGSLMRGRVSAGDEAVIVPSGLRARVRGIQSHGEEISSAEFGRRVAVNLAGVKVEEVRRGQTLGAPGAVLETRVLDAQIEWTAEPAHATRVRLAIGADDVVGKLFLSQADPGLAQIRLDRPTAAAAGQPLIIRRHSPPDLLGGGRVVAPQAEPRRKSSRAASRPLGSSLGDQIMAVVSAAGVAGATTDVVCSRLGRTRQDLGDEFEALLKAGRVRGFAGLWLSPGSFAEGTDRLVRGMRAEHAAAPSKAWVHRDKAILASGLPWSGKPLDRILSALAEDGTIRTQGAYLRDPSFAIRLTERQESFLARVRSALDEGGASPPSERELAGKLQAPVQAIEEILRLGAEAGALVKVADGVYFSSEGLAHMKQRISRFAGGRPFSASELRDELGSSRKYVVPLLEYLDSVKFTIRTGDRRVVR